MAFISRKELNASDTKEDVPFFLEELGFDFLALEG